MERILPDHQTLTPRTSRDHHYLELSHIDHAQRSNRFRLERCKNRGLRIGLMDPRIDILVKLWIR